MPGRDPVARPRSTPASADTGPFLTALYCPTIQVTANNPAPNCYASALDDRIVTVRRG